MSFKGASYECLAQNMKLEAIVVVMLTEKLPLLRTSCSVKMQNWLKIIFSKLCSFKRKLDTDSNLQKLSFTDTHFNLYKQKLAILYCFSKFSSVAKTIFN